MISDIIYQMSCLINVTVGGARDQSLSARIGASDNPVAIWIVFHDGGHCCNSAAKRRERINDDCLFY
jgi:regulator of replication initiation timing